MSYSNTLDQITKLIASYEVDLSVNFITWENLANQEVFNFNLSAQVDINEKWNVYSDFSMSHVHNKADYGDGAIVDVKAFFYILFQQQTISNKINFERARRDLWILFRSGRLGKR